MPKLRPLKKERGRGGGGGPPPPPPKAARLSQSQEREPRRDSPHTAEEAGAMRQPLLLCAYQRGAPAARPA